MKPFLAIFFWLIPLVSHASAIILDNGWTFERGTTQTPISPSSFLIHQVETNDCCVGKYALTLNKTVDLKSLNANPFNVFYVPGIGGITRLIIDGKEIPLSGQNFTSSGLLVPLPPMKSLAENFKIEIEIRGEPSIFVGFSRLGKSPLIGNFSEINRLRDHDNYYQNTVPLFNALILFLFCAIFILIYKVLHKRNRLYLHFSIALSTWAIFYLFVSGVVRDLNFVAGSLFHLPARTLAAFGTFLLVSRAAPKTAKQIPGFGLLCLATIVAESVVGYFGMPIVQSLLFIVFSTLSFYPLFKATIDFKKDLLGSLIGILGIFVVIGQLMDAIKWHQGIFHLNLPLPYLNRVTFVPLLLLSFGDCIIQFAESFHKLRAHLYKAKAYARAILHIAREGLSHDNIIVFLRVTSKICGFKRASLAQRQQDGTYRIVKLYGSLFPADGMTLDLDKTKGIRLAVSRGGIVSGSVDFISEGWHTSAFTAVPVPELKNPPYLLLLSDPRQGILSSQDALPYLSQISSAIWTNLERSNEQSLRVKTEKKFSSVVRQLDPSLFKFIESNIDKIEDAEKLLSSTRGIVFFDQKAYSTMTENFDDNTMGRFAGIVGKWVTESAARYGARISNFAGDAFLLETYSIGAESEEAIGRRTLNLVWSLAITMGDLNQILLKEGFNPITFRFGAHIGNVAAANLDFIQKGLSNSIGDTVNVAARLQALAKTGSIYISGELAKYAGDQFVVTSVPRQYVKGRMKKIEIFSLVGQNTDPGSRIESVA